MQGGSTPEGHQPVLLLLTTTERPSESFPSTYTQPSRMKGVSTNSERCRLSVQETHSRQHRNMGQHRGIDVDGSELSFPHSC